MIRNLVGIVAVAALVIVPFALFSIASSKSRGRTADEMSTDELTACMDKAARAEDFAMAIFYRDKIRERTALKKTG